MAYRMTPARRAALKKAQRISARKRRGRGKGKLAAANRRRTSYKAGRVGAHIKRNSRRYLIAAAGVGGAAGLAQTGRGQDFRAAVGDVKRNKAYRTRGGLRAAYRDNRLMTSYHGRMHDPLWFPKTRARRKHKKQILKKYGY